MKYQIGEHVECKLTNNKFIIKDYEKIGDCKLYYFHDGTALPESKINLRGFSTLQKLFSLSKKEKDQRLKNVLENLDRKLSRI